MKKRVIVIENDRSILEIIEYILREQNYDVISFTSGDKLVSKVKAFKPDAIILDIVKPTPEGAQLCHDLKAAKETSHIPVVVLSTHVNIAVLRESCADEVVEKPFDIDQLLQTVSKLTVA